MSKEEYVEYLAKIQTETVEFEDVTATAQTELALCCTIEGKEIWIPQSQIHEDSEVWRKDQKGTLIVTRWIAEQKGLV